MSRPFELVHGTLDQLLLKIVTSESLNGRAAGRRSKQTAGEVPPGIEGSLYTATEDKPCENNRRTTRLSDAITQVLELEEA